MRGFLAVAGFPAHRKGYSVDSRGMYSRVVAAELRERGQATQTQEFHGMLDEAEDT